MNTNIKIFLLCPVPDDQKPINEYIGLKENSLTNWTTLAKKNYDAKLFQIVGYNFLFLSLITGTSVINDFTLVSDWILNNLFISTTLLLLLLVIIVFRWKQNQKQFNQTRLFYEEGSWYDGQIWEKPLSLVKNDKLISTQKIEPILQRLYKTISIIGFFNLILLTLLQL